MIASISIMLFLFLSSLIDIRKRCFSTTYLLISGFSLSILLLMSVKIHPATHIFGLIIGIIMILISLYTNEAVGMGDSIIIAIVGFLIGISSLFELLFYSFIVLIPVSILLLAIKKANRKSYIPFIPFLFVGYIILFINHSGGANLV